MIVNRQRSATLTLIIINSIFFFIAYPLVLISPNLMDYLALNPSFVLQGKYLWTILTSMFMHGGIFHLLANMISLMFIGGLLEKLIGPKKFLGVYFASGLMGALMFILLGALFGNPDISAVGASGAIFGIAGMLAVLTPNLPVYIMFIPIAMPMWFGVILLMFGLWAVSASFNLPIGNTAHLGGLLVGVAYGLYLTQKHKHKAALIRKHFS